MSNWQNPAETVIDAHVQRIADAPLLALRNGQWFNRYITINFDVAGLARSNAYPLFQDYKKRIRDWLAMKRAGPFAYAATFENKGYEGKANLHVHMLAHVPF